METLIAGTADQLQASYWYVNYNVTSNSQGGLIIFFNFQMANTKEKELIVNNEIWWIASKIIDAYFIL